MKLKEFIRLPRRMFWALIMEGEDTRRMLEVFGRQGTGKLRLIPTDRHPTQEELDEALQQLKDMPRLLPFVVGGSDTCSGCFCRICTGRHNAGAMAGRSFPGASQPLQVHAGTQF